MTKPETILEIQVSKRELFLVLVFVLLSLAQTASVVVLYRRNTALKHQVAWALEGWEAAVKQNAADGGTP